MIIGSNASLEVGQVCTNIPMTDKDVNTHIMSFMVLRVASYNEWLAYAESELGRPLSELEKRDAQRPHHNFYEVSID